MARIIPLLAALSFCAPAYAQQACAPRPAVIERLAEGYGETPQTIGLDSEGFVVETYANTETGSWTIVLTAPGGMSCMVSSGGGFEITARDPEPQGVPG